MFFFRKEHPTHKRLSSVGFLFALLPALIWLDMMYALFREYILIPLYYSLSDWAYIMVMFVFPIIALVFATIGHIKTPKKTRDYGLAVMVLSIILVALMALAFSPLRGA